MGNPLVHFEFLVSDVQKMEIPNIGWWAMLLDPDQIPVMIFQSK